ncbi:MAG: NADH-quinone oxidoreductase subunit C, partial [Parvibaculaceae bacterium]
MTSFETAPMDESLTELGEHIHGTLEDSVLGFEIAFGELTIRAQAQSITRVLKFLRDDPACRFSTLLDVTGVDYPQRPLRFDVVYHLLSMYQNHRIRVVVQTDEDTPVPSVVPVYPTANWFERETFDMYGVL